MPNPLFEHDDDEELLHNVQGRLDNKVLYFQNIVRFQGAPPNGGYFHLCLRGTDFHEPQMLDSIRENLLHRYFTHIRPQI